MFNIDRRPSFWIFHVWIKVEEKYYLCISFNSVVMLYLKHKCLNVNIEIEEKWKRNGERSKGPVIIYNYFHTSEFFQNIIASNFFPILKIFISFNSRWLQFRSPWITFFKIGLELLPILWVGNPVVV